MRDHHGGRVMGGARRIVFPDAPDVMADCCDAEILSLVPGLEVHRGKPDPERLAALIRDAEALITFQTRFTDAILSACPHLSDISVLSTGYTGWVDVPAAERRGIRVQGVRGYADRTVAEHALALLLAATRQIAVMDRKLRAGVWEPRALCEVGGKTVAVIGLGGIGRAFATLAHGLGLRVVGWNRSPVADPGPVTLMDLDTALASADFVSLHLTLTDETRGLFDARRLDRLKPGAILINTARGTLVDEAALVERLASGRIAAAGLDVFASEPIRPDHPLLGLDNVVASAHAGWLGPEAARRLLRLGVDNLLRPRIP